MFSGYLIYLFTCATIISAAVAVPAAERAGQATINGTITIKFPNFVATFAANGTTHTFQGTSSMVMGTVDPNAVLTFNQASQLAGSQAFTGTEGPSEVNLNLDSGATLFWNLLPPTLVPIPISGSGTWSSS